MAPDYGALLTAVWSASGSVSTAGAFNGSNFDISGADAPGGSSINENFYYTGLRWEPTLAGINTATLYSGTISADGTSIQATNGYNILMLGKLSPAITWGRPRRS